MAYITFQPKDHFNTVLYTGDGSSSDRTITGVGFQPDWLWNKSRSNAYNHYIFDVLRGTNMLSSNALTADEDKSPQFSALTSDGFTIRNDAGSLAINANGVTFANWCWKAGGAGSSNSDGSITSTVSANTTAGFSIISWTGSGNNKTIGHGLGAVPKYILIKNLTDSSDWIVYHHVLGNASFLHLNTTDNEQAGTGIFNSTTPTSSVISLGSDNKSNGTNDNMIAYAFAEKTGFSHFNVYRGNNNSDGSFVYTGFKPALILSKRNSAGNSWSLIDNKRPGYNVTDKYLLPDTSATDQSTAVDILSNGFKFRTSAGNHNAASSYYYAAFAEAPLVGSNNVPSTAR